jgi:ribosomal protein S18 acetylase RimI-like enzyme
VSSFRIELLGKHDRTAFSSREESLDRYLREQVTQDIRRRLSNCFVALDAVGALAGYYTFAATSVPLTELPADITRRLPRYPSMPAGLIGRLAIDQRFQRQGLGSLLVVDAAARAMRAEPAIYALVVLEARFRSETVCRKGIACLQLPPLQPAAEPAYALLGASVGEAVGDHVSGSLLL